MTIGVSPQRMIAKGLSLSGAQIRVAELVQSGCDLGPQSRLGGCPITCNQPGEPALNRIALGGCALRPRDVACHARFPRTRRRHYSRTKMFACCSVPTKLAWPVRDAEAPRSQASMMDACSYALAKSTWTRLIT